MTPNVLTLPRTGPLYRAVAFRRPDNYAIGKGGTEEAARRDAKERLG